MPGPPRPFATSTGGQATSSEIYSSRKKCFASCKRSRTNWSPSFTDAPSTYQEAEFASTHRREPEVAH
eukprot:578172-Amphidinium_carterae.1